MVKKISSFNTCLGVTLTRLQSLTYCFCCYFHLILLILGCATYGIVKPYFPVSPALDKSIKAVYIHAQVFLYDFLRLNVSIYTTYNTGVYQVLHMTLSVLVIQHLLSQTTYRYLLKLVVTTYVDVRKTTAP